MAFPELHMLIFLSSCICIAYFLPTYFTIQLIFATIHELYCTLWYYLQVLLYYFSHLLPLSTILSVKNFQFQQNKWIPNRPSMCVFPFLFKSLKKISTIFILLSTLKRKTKLMFDTLFTLLWFGVVGGCSWLSSCCWVVVLVGSGCGLCGVFQQWVFRGSKQWLLGVIGFGVRWLLVVCLLQWLLFIAIDILFYCVVYIILLC